MFLCVQRERDRTPAEPNGGDGANIRGAAGRPEEHEGRVRTETPAGSTATVLQTQVGGVTLCALGELILREGSPTLRSLSVETLITCDSNNN